MQLHFFLAMVVASPSLASCGTRSELYSRDVYVPPAIGPLGLSLTVEELFQDCNVTASEDGVRFSGTLFASADLSESGAIVGGDAEVITERGDVLARFELDPFSLHLPDHRVTITKHPGTIDPAGGCQLCSAPVRVRVAVRSENPITPVQHVESVVLSARCTR